MTDYLVELKEAATVRSVNLSAKMPIVNTYRQNGTQM